MLNWMKIASGVLKLGGSIASNAIQRKRERHQIRELKQQRQENKQWYDQRYNEDATQRADAQALLNNTLQTIRERNRAAAGQQAVMGGTDESVAAEKQSGNELLAKTTSNIAADAANRKDEIEEQYRNKDAALQGQISGVRDARSRRIANSVVGYANTAAETLDHANGLSMTE
jgi:hypothetical protein